MPGFAHCCSVCLAAALLLPAPGRADIYAFTDHNGVRHITNVPNDPRYKLIMRTPKYRKADTIPSPKALPGLVVNRPGKPFRVNEANRRRFAGDIARVAGEHRLEPALLHAVISAESAYNPGAVSRAGAMGLMQLMPGTAERFGVDDPFDPIANLKGGARYLRLLLDQFQQLTLALAAYNAGENTVIRYGNAVPPYPETRTYVSRVLSFYEHYRRNP